MASLSSEPLGQSEVFVVRTLSAAHQILIDGELEPIHGHDFRVTAGFASEADPLELAPAVESLLARLSHTRLEAVSEAEGGHPSAERLARYLLSELERRGLPIRRVTVEESPGCLATAMLPQP